MAAPRKPASSTARQPARPAVKPQPAANAEPVADLGARPVTYWFPSIKLGSGEVIHCEHSRYGHESEAAAKRCVRSLLAQNLATPEPATPALDTLLAASQPKPPARKLRSGAEGVGRSGAPAAA
jgi:hypothetical protein